MNKSELVEVAAKEAGITKAAADKALSAIIGAVVKTVTQGESVTLVGFGTFKSAKRAARTGKNPRPALRSRFPPLRCRNLLLVRLSRLLLPPRRPLPRKK
jgi:DNA-binding protein HU-beta